ncbi:MAG TPA: LSm family protein [Nitrososphaerales archaeon]
MSIDMAIRVLDESLGQKVLIKLKGGKVIRGILQGFDQHMNLLLKESEEIIGDVTKNLGTLVVRGDNVVIISPPPG